MHMKSSRFSFLEPNSLALSLGIIILSCMHTAEPTVFDEALKVVKPLPSHPTVGPQAFLHIFEGLKKHSLTTNTLGNF